MKPIRADRSSAGGLYRESY